MRPVFEGMGTNINYMGPAGSGQHAKMANQIMIAGTMSGICEALNYAKRRALIWILFSCRVHRGGGQCSAQCFWKQDGPW